MATITTILDADLVSNGNSIINTNFANLNVNGTETEAGRLEITTNVEVEALTDDARAITPAKLAFGFIRTKDLLPQFSSIYDLGSMVQKYSDIWMSDQIHFDSQTFEVDSNGDILINGSIFTGPSLTGTFVELAGAQTVAGVKTFTNQLINESGLELSGTSVDLEFDERSTGRSGILFKDAGNGIAEIRYDDAADAIKCGSFDASAISWQFIDDIIIGEGEKTAGDFVGDVNNNGMVVNKLSRFRYNTNDSITTVSGFLTPVDWTGAPVFNIYPDEGESGQVIIAHKETDIFLPPLTRDGGSTNSGGITFTIVNMSNNSNVEIFPDASIGDLIQGAASISNAVRFSTITIIGIYKKQFGTGSKEGHWVIQSEKNVWA